MKTEIIIRDFFLELHTAENLVGCLTSARLTIVVPYLHNRFAKPLAKIGFSHFCESRGVVFCRLRDATRCKRQFIHREVAHFVCCFVSHGTASTIFLCSCTLVTGRVKCITAVPPPRAWLRVTRLNACCCSCCCCASKS